MTKKRVVFLHIALLAILLLTATAPIQAKEQPYMTGFIRWRSADNGFQSWQLSGALIGADGALRLDPATAAHETDPYAPGAYNGRNFYNGSSYLVGEALGPATATPFAFTEAIASWNADTPDGAWIETMIRAKVGGRWTKWYNLGVWASGAGAAERHSVSGQEDADGLVATDTLVLTAKKAPAEAFQLKVRLFSANGIVTPIVRNLSVAYSTAAAKKPALSAGDPALWGALLEAPECSQMVYPDGGEVWCSPTSTSMVLGYWGVQPGPCEPRVRATVEGVYDWIYDGHGNWPFNTAYAAALGYEGYVARFTGLAQAEEWIAAGVPVIVSFAWGKNDLTGAPIPSSNGHLAVLVGFDGSGNPIINDPAAAADADVQRTYDRAQFETQWLKSSGGTVYLIYPPGYATPAL
jgi:hypothetical protein